MLFRDTEPKKELRETYNKRISRGKKISNILVFASLSASAYFGLFDTDRVEQRLSPEANLYLSLRNSQIFESSTQLMNKLHGAYLSLDNIVIEVDPVASDSTAYQTKKSLRGNISRSVSELGISASGLTMHSEKLRELVKEEINEYDARKSRNSTITILSLILAALSYKVAPTITEIYAERKREKDTIKLIPRT